MVLQGWYQSLAGTGINRSRAGTAAAAGRDSRDSAIRKKEKEYCNGMNLIFNFTKKILIISSLLALQGGIRVRSL
jgi:hypothetical protein